jgi:hypothetical protein
MPEPDPNIGASPMSELTEESIPPVRPATPPRIIPAAWEDFPAFRETFLMYFTEPQANAALRIVGRLFHDLVLEYYHRWPDWPESFTGTEMRSALADLRHLEGYLAAIGREHEQASLTEPDIALSQLAAREAGELARIAEEIEAAIGREV